MEKERSRHKLYTRMRLWEFPDQYMIEPTEGVSGNILSVSRADGSMKLIDEIPQRIAVRPPKVRTIFGVMGTVKLLACSYLFVITERQSIGSYMGHPIFKVSSLKIFPCDQSLLTLPEDQKKLETEFSTILKNAEERSHGLFFSYHVDLTTSMQKSSSLGDESKLLPLWKQAEPRFTWNNYMMDKLIEHKLDMYLLPVVQGSFQHFQTFIGKDIADVTLIARRCNRRTGTRLWRRGADPDGNTANFVESEQILQYQGFTASFLQIRGTMPFLWEQIVDLTYKPGFDIIKPEEAPRVAERHFSELRKRYGSVVGVDLVNGHGEEGRLSAMYGKATEHIAGDDIRYIHFDFHRICGHVHFERLSILYEQIADFLNKKGYFLLNEKGEKVEEQHGVIRTNCVDCLDRTNVTQNMIARKIMESQLRRIGAFTTTETIASHKNFDKNYKIMWANHGDDISTQYSGTPALKGDFVRFGKRTMQGIYNDGCNALIRYYLNNFRDGTKQDAMDLLHGHFVLSATRDLNTLQYQKETITSFSVALVVVLVELFFAIMSLTQVPYDLRRLFFSLMWACVSVVIAAYVRANGRVFCNRPRLNKPRC